MKCDAEITICNKYQKCTKEATRINKWGWCFCELHSSPHDLEISADNKQEIDDRLKLREE